jgi:hypothetical protein
LNRYCKRLYGGGGCWGRTGFAGSTDQKVVEIDFADESDNHSGAQSKEIYLTAKNAKKRKEKKKRKRKEKKKEKRKEKRGKKNREISQVRLQICYPLISQSLNLSISQSLNLSIS